MSDDARLARQSIVPSRIGRARAILSHVKHRLDSCLASAAAGNGKVQMSKINSRINNSNYNSAAGLSYRSLPVVINSGSLPGAMVHWTMFHRSENLVHAIDMCQRVSM